MDRYISTIIGALIVISPWLHTRFQEYRKRLAIRKYYETLVKESKEGKPIIRGV